MNLKYRPKRRLFYPAGFLSLAILPILCLEKLAIEYADKTKPLRCLEIYFPPTSKSDYSYSKFSPEFYSKCRIYNNYFLTKNTQENKIELEKIKSHLDLIKELRDTINGVHISLNDTTPYKDFIKAIDISSQKWAPAFCVHDNDFWSYTIQDTAFEKIWTERHNRKTKDVKKKTIYDVFD